MIIQIKKNAPSQFVKDVKCDICGKSCKTEINTFEFMELKVDWGYGADKDGKRQTAQVCEKCVEEKLEPIIKFKTEIYSC